MGKIKEENLVLSILNKKKSFMGKKLQTGLNPNSA
jgi:hypothetical protein